MNIGNKVYLNNIDQIDEKLYIKVRVLKIWNFIRNNKVCSIEMILMDEEGTQYHARVFNQNFSRFRHLLKEDESYIVIKPNIAVVTNGFSYTDVIGQIVSFRPLETSNPVASKHYIKLTLSNLDSVHLKVTIFGSQTYQMSEYLQNNPTVNCVVIVMQFLKLNIWNDDFKGNFPLKTICEITEPIKAGDSDGLFPMQLNVLKNRKFGFLVDITEYNVNNYNNIYTVLRVTEDMSIVSELESKIELMDVISQTDESLTPSTID
ncbi:unnamed protein product [Lactuca saligna]|uniref:Replication protein A 70 kDa DNA-binding subunit B/D first OB fold domain-containing protein n=1 Tax=Lactuca saligna TaxID=75948 RepID=A0AA35VDR8_LACSI|nr:unnamed protein product [Lactuca saligna]